jgi:hypothetical protein
MAAPSESASDANSGLPGELFRSIVSLLLFVHLFAVGLAMLTGNVTSNSALLLNIKARTPGLDTYLWQLWLDHGYDYHFISFMPMFDETASVDWDNRLEATLNYADDRQERIDLPEAGIWPSDRRHRLQQLAKFLMTYSQWPEGPQVGEAEINYRHLVGRSVGGALLRENPAATSVTLRWYYHRGLTGAEVRGNEPPAWTPEDPRYFVTVGTMRVELVDGQPESMDSLPPLEVSPLKTKPEGGKQSAALSANGDAAKDAAAKAPSAKATSAARPNTESN